MQLSLCEHEILNKLKALFKSPLVASQEAEILFLRAQNLELLAQVKNLTEKPALTRSIAEDYRPKVLDHETKRYRAKTDAEIEADRLALAEMGVI